MNDDMKTTPADQAVAARAHNMAGEQLRQFIERIELMEAEKRDIQDGIKEIYAEAGATGYDAKIIRKIVSERKRNRDDVAEEAAIMDTYRLALGMA